MTVTIKKLSDNILTAARTRDLDAMSSTVDGLRCCAPELVEVAIRQAMKQEPTFSDWIREKFLDPMFPFPNKGFSNSDVS